MTNTFLSSARYQLVARGWLFGLVLLTAVLASAQTNYVSNPDFDQPLRPDNWQIVYVGASSESDFWIHGRSTLAHRDKVFGTWDGNYFGLHFKPYTDAPLEAYATQIVSNLTASANYVVTAWMALHYQSGFGKVNMTVEAQGDGALAVSDPCGGWIRADTVNPVTGTYDTNGWAAYSVTVPASANGTIEVRLHYQKPGYTANRKWLSAIDGFFDEVSVTPQ